MLIPAIGLLLGLGVFFITLGVVASLRSSQADRRLAELSLAPEVNALDVQALDRPFAERVILPAIRRLTATVLRSTPERSLDSIRFRLIQAGAPQGLDAQTFLGLKLAFAVLGGLVILAFTGPLIGLLTAVVFGIGVAAFGYVAPDLWLSQQVAARQAAIRAALPDALDMLTICAEAGLFFDAAMTRLVARWDNALTQEFRQVLAEIAIGHARHDALRHLSERTGVEDLSTFVTLLIQAELMGSGIVNVLRTQSAFLRMQTRQRAERLAREAGIKMLIPLVIFIFPPIFIVLMGPALITALPSLR
ncbi:MAG: type II secretion system F family protein [Chloroflexi bacterium]|nr:type II secretion system F family protein [Chloroflexota bacterium]